MPHITICGIFAYPDRLVDMGDETNSILPASSIDRRLLQAAAKYATAEEMSEAVLGRLTPAQCAERVHHLLTSKTILDEVQERRLLLIQMAEWLDWLKTQRDNPKSWAAISRTMKLLSDQVERSNINVSDVSTKLATEHARYFVDGFTLGFERVLKALGERDEIVIEEDEIQELLEIGAHASHEYIERVTQKNDE